MKKTLLIFLIFVFPISHIFSQYSLSGSVTDDLGNIIPYTHVGLFPENLFTESDENGFYNFESIPAGSHTLVINLSGYYDFEIVIVIFENTKMDIVLNKRSYKLKDIYINATKADDKMPFSYKNINDKEISKNNYGQDLPYILQNTPSVTTTSDAGMGIGYTGLRIRGTDPTRINVTINDIPFNDAESQQVYWVDIPDIASSSKNIQIQRGVGTSTNGAGAFGGSINIETNQINTDPYFSIDGGYGSFNTSLIKAKAGTGLMNDRYSLDFRYSKISSDGYIDRARSDLNSFYFSAAKISNNSSLRFNALLGKEVTYQSWYGVPVQYAVKNDSMRTYNEPGTDYFQHFPAYEDQIDDYTQNHLQLIYNKSINNNLLFNSALHFTSGYGYYQQYKVGEDLSEYKIDTTIVRYSDIVRQKWLNNKFYGITYSLKYNHEKLILTYGGAANNYDGDHYGIVHNIILRPGYEGIEHYYDGNGAKFDFNNFIKAIYTLHDKLYLFADLQYRFINYKLTGQDSDFRDYDINVNHNFFNPKLGLNFEFNKSLSTYYSLAIANKEPNRSDYKDNFQEDYPKSEKLTDHEIGFKFNKKNVLFQTNLYMMNYNDQLIWTGQLNNVGDPLRVNVDKSYRMGIEFEAAYNFDNIISFEWNATFSKNKIKNFIEIIPEINSDYEVIGYITNNIENTDILLSPKFTGFIGFNLDIIKMVNFNNKNSLNLIFNTKFVDDQYLDNAANETAKVSSYSFSDLEISFAPKIMRIHSMQLALKIGNIFNANFFNNGWTQRIKSTEFNPASNPYFSDPYAIHDKGDYYYYMGLFPQAFRNYMLRIKVDLQ